MTSSLWVAGTGVVGLTCALGMAERGLDVTLAGPKPIASSRVYAINEASKRLFERLGIWQLLEGLAPYHHMHVWDKAGGASIDFDASLLPAGDLGTIVLEATLTKALYARIKEHPRITCVDPIDAIAPSNNGLIAHIKDSTATTPLLILATGKDCALTRSLAVPFACQDYHQHALTTTLQTEKPHDFTAYQVFSNAGILALLPSIDAHKVHIVWSLDPHICATHCHAEAGVFEEAVAAACAYRLGKMQLLEARKTFPLMMRHAKVYSGSHWVLVGDAAHTVHPLAGLGLNLGLADVDELLSLPDTALFSHQGRQTYQRARKTAVSETIFALAALQKVFLQTHKPLITLRSLGLAMLDKLPGIKRHLIQKAMGIG